MKMLKMLKIITFFMLTSAFDPWPLKVNQLTRPITANRYSKTSNIRGTLVGNKSVDQSDVVGAAPVVAAPPTTSSFSS